MQKILSLVRRAVDKYDMIDDNDVIAVGVSGGKDSLALLCSLAEMRRFYPNHYTLKAVMIDPMFYGEKSDYSEIIELCRRLEIEYVIETTDLYEIIFEIRQESNPCSLCSRMRRGILNTAAKKLGCNKLALGHNKNDLVETFYMNLFNGGHLGTFSPITYLSRKDITVIRPLIYVEERETNRIAKKYHLPVIKSRCPADKNTSREETKELIKSLSKKYNGLTVKTLGAIERANIDGYKEKGEFQNGKR